MRRSTTSSVRSSARAQQRTKVTNITRRSSVSSTTASNIVEYGVECVNNNVQKQIELMFSDVANDETSCSFSVRCLGSLPLRSKVSSLYDMQEPLRRLYLTGAGHNVRYSYSSELFFPILDSK